MKNALPQQSLLERPWFNKVCLLLVAFLWGVSFVTMKGLVSEMPVFYLLAIRNVIATATLVLALRGRLVKQSTPHTMAIGVGMGLLGFGAYAMQTIGLTMTSPGKSAFLTACYCVMVPFLAWIFGLGKPGLRHVMAAIICTCGIGFVALDAGFPLNFGDVLSLADGLFFALQFILLAKWGRDDDSLVVSCWEFGIMALCSALCSMVFEPGYVLPTPTIGDVATMLFLGVVCSCFCFAMFNHAITKIDPAEGSILSALEAPFGVLSSMVFYHEAMTGRLVFGFSLIFAAIVISEAGDAILARLRTARGPLAQYSGNNRDKRDDDAHD